MSIKRHTFALQWCVTIIRTPSPFSLRQNKPLRHPSANPCVAAMTELSPPLAIFSLKVEDSSKNLLLKANKCIFETPKKIIKSEILGGNNQLSGYNQPTLRIQPTNSQEIVPPHISQSAHQWKATCAHVKRKRPKPAMVGSFFTSTNRPPLALQACRRSYEWTFGSSTLPLSGNPKSQRTSLATVDGSEIRRENPPGM